MTIPTLDVKTIFASALNADGSFDMEKARECWKAHLRGLRAPLFVLNDLVLRDCLLGDHSRQILNAAVARRDVLRGVTSDRRIETAKTIEELVAVIPKVLTD